MKFIEMEEQSVHPDNCQAQLRSLHNEAAKILSGQLTEARKLGIEISYELHCQDQKPRAIIAAACEGRDYRRCRSILDEFTSNLSKHLRLNRSASHFVTEVDSIGDAERVLMMPLFVAIENLSEIESDGRNAKLTLSRGPDCTRKLRIMHLSDLPMTEGSNEASLLDGFIEEALAHGQPCDFAFVIQVRPLSDATLGQEMRRLGEAYQATMARFMDGINSGANFNEGLTKDMFFRREKTQQAANIVNEIRAKLRQLRDAENSGYFEASITLIGDPVTVENIARLLRVKISGTARNSVLRIDRLPPEMLRSVVRRECPIPSGRLNGRRMISILTPFGEGPMHQAPKEDTPADSLDACLADETQSH
ncbi:MAG: hypothetical protein WED04_12465 [Promethearchaeati archaeon SRVP18_Atabeyarchaeia-1]